MPTTSAKVRTAEGWKMISTMSYQFLVQGIDDQWYQLDIRPHDEASEKYLTGVWQRLSGAVEKACHLQNTPLDAWVGWKPWEWCGSKRADYGDRKPWMAWCGDHLVGFLNVWAEYPSQHEAGRKILYIEHLAAFPGDQNTKLWCRRYRHVGKALLAFAIKLSEDAGYAGRTGLHSENQSSLEFYRKVALNRQVVLFHPEKTGIIGPTPHGHRSDGNLTYLEMPSAGALNFLEDYRHE